MKTLAVYLKFSPDKRRLVGTLAQTGQKVVFEYAPSFLENPLWLSPYKLPPEARFHEHIDLDFGPVFGLFDDSLPDGWGLLLMDRYFRKTGIDPQRVSVLDRLSFIGDNGMGALVYEPAMTFEPANGQLLRLHELARHARNILSGDTRDVLPQLMRAGGSPGGARPKILIGLKENHLISGETDLPPGFTHWIVKFNSGNDLPDAGPVEYAYSLMARAAGIDMTKTRLFETSQSDRFFGITRFDREENKRLHMHTFGNLIHSNFRIPSADYADLFKITRNLTRNHKDVIRVFYRMVFNVLAHNRDDHVKNFAFMLADQGDWHLTPAYDLTFSHGPGGQHSMTLAGEGENPGRKEMVMLGQQAGLSAAEIGACLDQSAAAVEKWPEFARKAGVTSQSMKTIQAALAARLIKQ